MKELIQKRIWDRRQFKLMEDCVQVRIKTPTEDAEYSVKYEELGFEKVIVRKKEASIFFLGLMVLTCFAGKLMLNHTDITKSLDIILLVAFLIFLFGVLLLVWADTRKPLLGINGGEKSLAMLRNSPDEETVDRFVAELHERIRDTIIAKRLRPYDMEVSFKQKKMMLEHLREEGVVSDSKYEELLAQIKLTNWLQ